MIGVVAGQPEGLEQRFELQKDLVCAATKDVGQDLSCVVIDGMPQPAWEPAPGGVAQGLQCPAHRS